MYHIVIRSKYTCKIHTYPTYKEALDAYNSTVEVLSDIADIYGEPDQKLLLLPDMPQVGNGKPIYIDDVTDESYVLYIGGRSFIAYGDHECIKSVLNKDSVSLDFTGIESTLHLHFYKVNNSMHVVWHEPSAFIPYDFFVFNYAHFKDACEALYPSSHAGYSDLGFKIPF